MISHHVMIHDNYMRVGESPLFLRNLSPGEHWLRVIPGGCSEAERQTFFFDVPSL